MISAMSFVKKGVSGIPKKFELTPEEFTRIQEELGVQLEDAKADLSSSQAEENLQMENSNEDIKDSEEESEKDSSDLETENAVTTKGDLSIYDLENYDNSENETVLDVDQAGAASMFSNIKGLQYYDNPADDPYIQLNDDEDVDNEMQELEIDPNDNLILACKTEDDVSHLEIYVYEDGEDNLYVHHEIMLPSFPLCVEWLDFPISGPSGRPCGNYVAIGTFDPQVEIWDLDSIDPVFPVAILGQIPATNHTGPQSGKGKHGPARVAKRPQAERHVDAVMAISVNRTINHLVATGSADTTVKLWDLNRPKTAVSSFNHHKNKVQAVCWNNIEPTVLLTGGYDKLACAFDTRAAETVAKWNLKSDVECMKWDPFRSEIFYVSTEDGIVQSFDVRSPTRGPLFTLQAHDSAVSALDVNCHIPGCLVTGSGDKKVKIWSITEDKPKCLITRDLDAGNVFSANFSPDSPHLLAIGGSRGKVVVWNLANNAPFRKGFPKHQFQINEAAEEQKEVMEVQAEGEDGDSDSDEVMSE